MKVIIPTGDKTIQFVTIFQHLKTKITDANITFDEEKPATTGYGINGFRLEFEDSSNLGTDSSANGNNLTEVSLATSQQSTDTPFTE